MDAAVIKRLAHASVLLPDLPGALLPDQEAAQSSGPGTAVAAAASAVITAGGRTKFTATEVQRARIRQCLLVVMVSGAFDCMAEQLLAAWGTWR
jgi:hypothetical protein